MRRVEAFDVEGRVGFGITKLLCVCQALGEADALVPHTAEDVVAGAVHDAIDAGDAGRAEALAQRLDHRDAAGDGCFEAELGPRFLRDARQVHPMPGQEGLVGRHDRTADLQSGADRREGRTVLAADQLDEEIDPVGLGERDGIIEPFEVGRIDPAIPTARTGAHRRHGDLAPQFSRQFLAILLDDAHQGGTDVAETGNTNPERRLESGVRLFLHRLEDAGARVGARLASLAQVEHEQRVPRDGPSEPRRGPATGGNEGFDGLAERLDIGHGNKLSDVCESYE